MTVALFSDTIRDVLLCQMPLPSQENFRERSKWKTLICSGLKIHSNTRLL